ncbi:FG-GAP repeat domain-containing protein [Pseudoroseicyclus sp. CXY001]|uniref:FG-GAP repeat domain-containing protein n=1 Tax=Pseudoroseicyclus sp. CXY001 TaxID=3242492 RepID=UPI003570B166
MRGAALLLALWAGGAAAEDGLALIEGADRPVRAVYDAPTDRYDHGVLGDAIEWGALVFTFDRCPACANFQPVHRRLTLPESRVFEDLEPRLADIDGDGVAEAITVESDLALGARLAVYAPSGLMAATPFIGQPHRWLAPLGAADLDGDGRVELAYVDRPHLARVLRVVRQDGAALVEVAALSGVTAHRIGEDWISGGIRDCGVGPEIIVASPDWARVLAVTFDGAELTARDIGSAAAGRPAFTRALRCEAP